MLNIRRYACAAGVMVLFAASPAAHAQWAVVDVGAIGQLVREVAIMESDLATARGELQQAQQSYRALTGHRGMAQLLSGTVRNYLPTSLSGLEAILRQQHTSYAQLASAMRVVTRQYAVLTPSELAALPAGTATRIRAARRRAALLEAIADDALENASSRFAALQQLIGAISNASDVKASLDLEARISAEQAMLENEQTKLQVLFETMRAKRELNSESERERIVAEQGHFTTRFAPVP